MIYLLNIKWNSLITPSMKCQIRLTKPNGRTGTMIYITHGCLICASRMKWCVADHIKEIKEESTTMRWLLVINIYCSPYIQLCFPESRMTRSDQ